MKSNLPISRDNDYGSSINDVTTLEGRDFKMTVLGKALVLKIVTKGEGAGE